MSKDFKITMRAARVNVGLSQSEIAEKLGVTKQTIVRWEAGTTIPPTDKFAKFCKICGVDMSDIFFADMIYELN